MTPYRDGETSSDFLSVGTVLCLLQLMCLTCSVERMPITVMMVADVLASHRKLSKITTICNRILHIASYTNLWYFCISQCKNTDATREATRCPIKSPQWFKAIHMPLSMKPERIVTEWTNWNPEKWNIFSSFLERRCWCRQPNKLELFRRKLFSCV